MAVAEQVEDEQVRDERSWPARIAPLGLVSAFGVAIVAGLLVGVIGALAGASLSHPPPVVSLIATVLQDVALIASAVFFAAQIVRPRPEHFGLRPTNPVRAGLVLGAGYAAFVGFAAVWVSALHIHDKEKLVDQLGTNDNAVALVAVCVLTCVIAPIAEEVFFRGFFFTALRNRLGPWPSAVITGVVFGAIHAGSAPVGYLVPLAFFGVVLCVVYWKTASLYPCIGLHALNNAVALGSTEHWHDWQIPVLVVAALTAITLTLRSVARMAPAQ